jgi:hypothetical protein
LVAFSRVPRREDVVGNLQGFGLPSQPGHLGFQLLQGDHGVPEREHPDRDVPGPLKQPVDHRSSVFGRERTGGTGEPFQNLVDESVFLFVAHHAGVGRVEVGHVGLDAGQSVEHAFLQGSSLSQEHAGVDRPGDLPEFSGPGETEPSTSGRDTIR